MEKNNELAKFQRQNSSTITDQGTEGTCYAHACSRVILNFIRRIIPDEFYPLEKNDGCGNIEINTRDLEAEKYIENVFDFSESCSEKNKKNILLFAYIFTLIKNFFGCKGERIIIVLRWFRKSFENFNENDSELAKGKFFDTSTNKEFFKNFRDFNDEKYEIVEKLLEKFKTEMTLKELGISEYEKELDNDNNDDISLIKFILDEQLYIVLTSKSHAVTAIGYEEENEDFFIIIKNSWGNKTYDNFFFGLPYKDGKLRVNIDTLRIKIKMFSFLLPHSTIIPRSEVLDETDKEYRTKAKAKLTNCETNEDCKFFGKNGICDEKLCYFDSKEGGKKKKTKKRKESKNKRKAKKNSKSQKNFKRKNV